MRCTTCGGTGAPALVTRRILGRDSPYSASTRIKAGEPNNWVTPNRVIALCSKGDHEVQEKAEATLELPELSDDLDPILLSVPLQLLAYHISVLKGTDVDQPRNLAKSVTVE